MSHSFQWMFWVDSRSFSAPLTPTIRRYLDIPGKGGAAKVKAPSKPPAPTAHKQLHGIGPSSTAVENVALPAITTTRVQHPRVEALHAKAPRRTHIVVEPLEPVAGPSHPTENSSRSPSPTLPPKTDALPLAPPRLTSSRSDVLSQAPPTLGKHGRSVSHNVLSSAPANPLSNPARPHLPSSFSTISLPADSNIPQPVRRFAPPARILRTLPLMEEGFDLVDQPTMIYTPSGATVLRNPSRPAPTILGKRLPGAQAQRRAVTAPTPNVQDRIRELESVPVAIPPSPSKQIWSPHVSPAKSHPARSRTSTSSLKHEVTGEQIDPAAVQLPPSPSPGTHNPFDAAMGAVLVPAVEATMVSSPSMPVLMRSTGASEKDTVTIQRLTADPHTNTNSELCHHSVPMLGNGRVHHEETSQPNAIAIASSAGNSVENFRPAATMTHSVTSGDFAVAQMASEHTKEVVTKPVAESSTQAAPIETSPTFAAAAPGDPSRYVATEPDPPQSSIVITSSKSAAPNAPSKAVAIAATAARRVEHAVAVKAKAPVLKVATARVAPLAQRSVPIAKRAFKPTSQTAPSATTTKVSVPPSKPVSTVPSKPETSVSSSTNVSAATSSTIAPKPATVRVPSASALTKPTAASAARVADARKPVALDMKRVPSGGAKLSAAPTILPPVKKERVRLKPPLPSFRPTRGGGMSASTSSVAHARVKPESIPLPLSPGEKAKLPPKDIPLPRSPIRSVSSSTLASMPAVTKEYNTVSPNSSGRNKPMTSPVNISAPRPASPLLTTDAPADLPSRPPSAADALGLSNIDPADKFNSTSTRYTSSHASTAPPQTDGETDSDLEGVTFNVRRPSRPILVPKARSVVEKDLMDFSASTREGEVMSVRSQSLKDGRSDVSTPAKSAEGMLARLVGGTPRRALVVRNANTPRGDEVV